MSTHDLHPVSQGILTRVLQQFAEDDRIVERPAWWAQHGHSCERWLQFELAFLLNQELRSTYYAVGCERNYVDIVIFSAADPESPFSKQIPLADIELKWYANWWFKDEGAWLLNDVEKIDGYLRPALALGVWLFVTPKSNASRYRWILEQVNKGIGVKTRHDACTTLSHSPYGPPEIEAFAQCANHEDFDSMSLWAAGYFNKAAGSARVTTVST